MRQVPIACPRDGIAPGQPGCKSADGSARAQAGTHRDDDAGIGGRVHGLRHTGGFAADEQDIALPVGQTRIGHGALGGQHDEPAPRAGVRGAAPPRLESGEGGMAGDGEIIEIVHPGATEVPVAHRKPCGLDDRRVDAEAGAHP